MAVQCTDLAVEDFVAPLLPAVDRFLKPAFIHALPAGISAFQGVDQIKHADPPFVIKDQTLGLGVVAQQLRYSFAQFDGAVPEELVFLRLELNEVFDSRSEPVPERIKDCSLFPSCIGVVMDDQDL